MRKIQILGAAFFAVLAFSAIGVANASAHEWLTLAGAKLTKAEPSVTDGKLQLRATELSPLIGGGEVEAECTGTFKGTVGLGAADLVELVEGPKGEKDQQIDCTIVKSTNSLCKTGELALLAPLNLDWKTELILGGTNIYDDFETEKEGATELGYKLSCKGLENDCLLKLDRAIFLGNNAEGAVFDFLGELVSKCTSGKGTVKGKGTVLKFLAN